MMSASSLAPSEAPRTAAARRMEAREKLADEHILKYRPGQRYEVAQGRAFHTWAFEAVVGAEVPERTGLKLGSKFQATHQGSRGTHDHTEQWEVVGVLAPTKTPADRLIFISLTSTYAIEEHQDGIEEQLANRLGITLAEVQAMRAEKKKKQQPPARPAPVTQAPATRPTTAEAHEDHDHDHPTTTAASRPATARAHDDHDDHDDDEHDHDAHAPGEEHAGHQHPYVVHDGVIYLRIPRDERALTAILARSRGESGQNLGFLLWAYQNGDEAMGVNPAFTMREFFANIFRPATLLLLVVALLVTIVAAVGILVSIYNSVAARTREIAILRALGATRLRILGLICFEAGLIGFLGGVIGIFLGHGLCGIVSALLYQRTGQGLNWLLPSWLELLYLGIVTLIAVLAGLIPALKAYRTPVATNLVGG